MTPNIITIVGKSNSGKTTLLEKIVANLTQRGFSVGTAKHTHHEVDMDQEGKDSWRHRKAGAASTLLLTDSRVALIKEDAAPYIQRIRTYLSDRDIIICEGFKKQELPKIEIFRKDGPHKEPLCMQDSNLIAFVTDSDYRPAVPVFGLEDIDRIADFIQDNYLPKAFT